MCDWTAAPLLPIGNPHFNPSRSLARRIDSAYSVAADLEVVSVSDQRAVFAVDLGGTRMRGALITPEGGVLMRDAVPTQASRGEPAAMRRLAGLLERMTAAMPSVQVVGIGMALAGPIDPVAATVHNPPNLPTWNGTSPTADLTANVGLPAWVHNDASLAALGEYVYGIGRGMRDLVMVTLGTGVGGGLVLDGRVYGGIRGFAGEIGHLVVEPAGPLCPCGGVGCLEVMASGTALARMARERLERGEESVVRSMVRGDVNRVRAETLVRAEARSDRLAGEVLREGGRYLGVGVASLRSVLDPEMIVIGGGVASNSHIFWPAMAASARAHGMRGDKSTLPVTPTVLGDDAGLLGAAAMAWGELGVGPSYLK